jgi:hypothetical protein
VYIALATFSNSFLSNPVLGDFSKYSLVAVRKPFQYSSKKEVTVAFFIYFDSKILA